MTTKQHPWRKNGIKEVFDKDKIKCGLKARKLEKHYEYVQPIHEHKSYFSTYELKKDAKSGKYYKSYRKAESHGWRIIMRFKETEGGAI